MLKIALLGTCPVQLSELATALNPSTQALQDQIILVTADGVDALQADLPGFDLVLLAGIETPEHSKPLETPFFAPSKMAPHPVPSQEAIDHSIRTALARSGVAYRVLYGTTGERLAYALQAVESLQPSAHRSRQITRPGGLKNQPWVWMCDKCSDPQCEHRLLTALLVSRDSAAPNSGEQPRPLLNR